MLDMTDVAVKPSMETSSADGLSTPSLPLSWTDYDSKEMFQKYRLWVTYIGNRIDIEKAIKGVQPVYIWPEQVKFMKDYDEKNDNNKSKKRKFNDLDDSSNGADGNDDSEHKEKKTKFSAMSSIFDYFQRSIVSMFQWTSSLVYSSTRNDDKEIDTNVKEVKSKVLTTEEVNNLIFADLKGKGYFVGPGDVYGGDYNIYKGGDPSNSHSAGTIRVVRSKKVSTMSIDIFITLHSFM